ncbi:MAG TPA: hypothetical protein VHW09_11305 [Bryobacteraceae bacterium]|jgi:hypothetical protein|nr:hypothetical protein [Bryobacteraceae bacterium]
MVQSSLKGFRKIPFACSYLPGKANLHMKLGLFAVAFLFFTRMAIELEYRSLRNNSLYWILVAVLMALGAWARWRNDSAPGDEILFEEVPPSDIEALNLHDRGPRGGMPAPFSVERSF